MIEDESKPKREALARVMCVAAEMVTQAPGARVTWEQYEDRVTGELRLRFDVAFTSQDLIQMAINPIALTYAAQAASKKATP